MPELIVYSPQNNNRLKYVLDYVLNERCGLDYILTDSRKDLSDGRIVINYSAEELTNTITIDYSLFLQNNQGVPEFEKLLEFQNLTSSFDVFAAIFYLLARVEEYDAQDLDTHGRYQAESSILYKKGLLDYPVIDAWIRSFKDLLDNNGIKCKAEQYELISTIDIDHLYAYKHKSTGIKLGSLARDILSLKFLKVSGRLADKDPYDRIDDMIKWNRETGLDPTFFVLTAQQSTYDKSLPPSSIPFITTIGTLAQGNEIGIHPSYASNASPHILKKEIRDLEAVIGRPITKSRQHYLRLSLPETYRKLYEQGIAEDYTMGYASQLGFRAGTSRPFFWYDLHKDTSTNLLLVPFQIMDVTLKNYLSLDPQKAIEKSQSLIDTIKDNNGCCSIIWHNSSFYEAEGWEGWEEVYKTLLQSV